MLKERDPLRPLTLRERRQLPVVEVDLPLIWVPQTGEQTHQCAFPRAVWPNDRGYGTGLDRARHPGKHTGALGIGESDGICDQSHTR